MANYRPPEKFYNGMTPAEFDKYRHIQDDFGDALAKSLFEFGMHWAENQDNPRLQEYDDAIKDAKRHIHNAEKAYHFFDLVEKAINDPHPAEAETRYRYKWDEKVVRLADELKSDIIDRLDDYFDDTREVENDPFAFLFDPYVQGTLERGARVLTLYGPNVIFILAVRSLLKQYAAFNASNVLVSTKFLTRFPHRRIFETVQFLIDVITPGNLKKDGKGIQAIKKLRLVHALVRYRIKIKETSINKKFTQWNSKDWGDPINQQDMIFAIHTFSIEIIRGLQKVGYFLDLTEAERVQVKIKDPMKLQPLLRTTTIKQDYYMAWHHIGKALGVRDEINPKSYEDGWELQQYIYYTQFRLGTYAEDNPEQALYPNLTSPVLAEPLVNFLTELLPTTNRRKDALALVAFYNDEEDYDPIFKDILGLDIKGLSSSTFKEFLNGSLYVFDWFMEFFYKYNPQYGIGNKVHFKKVGSINRAIFMRLRKMSKSWQGSAFTLRDGLDNRKGAKEVLYKQQRNLKSSIFYFIGFVLTPVIFIFLGPISWFIKRRIAKLGKKYKRPNYNDQEKIQSNIEHFVKENKTAIAGGYIVLDDELVEDYSIELPEAASGN